MKPCNRAFLVSFIPVAFATIGFALGMLANIYCETVSFKSQTENVPSVKLGPWYFQEVEVLQVSQPTNRVIIRDTCTSYSGSTNIDSKWKTARAFSIIGPIIGGVTIFWNWLAPCFYKGEKFWRYSGMIFLFCCMCQGLTLLFLDSYACKDNSIINDLRGDLGGASFADECSMALGARSNIASTCLWFLAGALMLCVMKAPTRPEREPAETQTVTYTKTEQPDGTQVVTEEVVKGQYVEGDPQVKPESGIDPEKV